MDTPRNPSTTTGLTPVIPASRPDITGGRALLLALAATVLLGALGVPSAVAGFVVVSQPVSAVWLTLVPIVAMVVIAVLTIGSAWRNVLVLPARRRRRFERLAGDRVVLNDGRRRDDQTLLLHGDGVELRSREDFWRRSKFKVYRPRTLIELVAPRAGRGTGVLLLADFPSRAADPSDPPAQSKPRAELAAIAAAVGGSPHPSGRQAAQRIEALIAGLPR